MPRVPTYDETQVAPAPLPNVGVQAQRSQLQDVGVGLNQAAQGLGAVVEQQQHQRDADQLFRAETSLKDSYRQYESTLQERRGQNAWGVTNDVSKWWDTNVDANSKQLENDTQRRLFAVSAGNLRQQSLDSASKFEQQERHVSLEESAKSSITSSINLAAASTDNPQALAGAKEDVLKRIQVLSDLNGWTPERRKAEESQQLTNLHSQVIQALVDTNPEGARAYLDANKAEINGSNLDAIDKLVRTGAIRGQAQTATEALIAEGGSRTETLTKARKLYKDELEDEVVQRIHTRFAEQDAIREHAEKQTADQAWDLFARVGSVSKLPTSLVQSLDGRTLTALKHEEEMAITREQTRTDWPTYYDLKQMATQQPADFTKLDLRQYKNKLGSTEFKGLADLQATVAKGDSSHEVATLEQQLARSHDLLGWKPSDKEKRGQFDSATYQAIAAEQKNAGGKKMSFDDRQKVIDRLMVDGEVVSGHWYSPDHSRKFYQVAGTEDAAKFVPTIPDDERKKIEGALKRAGRPITDEGVMLLYKRKNNIP